MIYIDPTSSKLECYTIVNGQLYWLSGIRWIPVRDLDHPLKYQDKPKPWWITLSSLESALFGIPDPPL